MKRSVQILLLFACSVSLFAGAQEETMEERKRRITRKYLQKRVDLTQGDMVVPDTAVENEEVLSSEKFKDPQVALQRQEPGARMPAPSPQRPRPSAANRNWLLAGDPEAEDPYANPFARKETKDEPKKQTDWTTWGTEREASPYTSPYTLAEGESRFNWRSYDSKRQGGLFGSQDTSSEGIQSAFQSQYPARDGRSLYGQQRESQTPYSTGGLDFSRDKTFDSTLIQNPFLRETTPSTDQSFGFGSRKQPGYTPYKSPFQTQLDHRKEQWKSYTEPGQKSPKQDPYKKWKEQNPQQFDPMRDDAFIDELMPKTQR